MNSIDTEFEHWQIRWDADLLGAGVALVWQVASRYGRDCLVVQLLAEGARPLAEPPALEPQAVTCGASVAVFPGGQVEMTTHLPLTVYADPRAAVLSLELAGLFVVQDGVLSVEPD